MRSDKFSNFDFEYVNSKLYTKKTRIDIGTYRSAPVSRNWFSQLNDIFVIGIEPNLSCL
jgi:hypothetical protein